jgi:hypothetical protein
MRIASRLEIDQDLWDLTQRYVLDSLAILKRAGFNLTLDRDALDFLVQATAEPGQAIRLKAGFKYEPPVMRPDTV